MPAAVAARAASRLSDAIDSTASGKRSPVALCLLFRTPTPSGFVSDSGWPGRPASLRINRSGSTKPVTAMPYLGSGSSMLCPPAT